LKKESGVVSAMLGWKYLMRERREGEAGGGVARGCAGFVTREENKRKI
jgi:hypothetical protein